MAVAYIRAQSVSLPHEPRIQKWKKKKKTPTIPADYSNFRKGTVQSKLQPTLSGAPSSMTMWAWSAYKRDVGSGCCVHAIHASNKNFILNVGMEKILKQDLGWRVSVLPNPAI